jgi:orotate phosphoribosyltransferase
VTIFWLGRFTLHSGAESKFKIDCDALTEQDLEALAWVLAEKLPPFLRVEGVPSGGLELARELERYCDENAKLTLIVDDVLTTGASMEEQRNGRSDVIGCVIFARGECPSWVLPLFKMS